MNNGASSPAAAEHDHHHIDFWRPPPPRCAPGICNKCGPPGDGSLICHPKEVQQGHGTKRPKFDSAFGDEDSSDDSGGPVELKVVGELHRDPETNRIRLYDEHDTTHWCKTWSPHPVDAPNEQKANAFCKDCTSLVGMVLDRGYAGLQVKDDQTGLWHMCLEGFWDDGPLCVQQPLLAGLCGQQQPLPAGFQVVDRPNYGDHDVLPRHPPTTTTTITTSMMAPSTPPC